MVSRFFLVVHFVETFFNVYVSFHTNIKCCESNINLLNELYCQINIKRLSIDYLRQVGKTYKPGE